MRIRYEKFHALRNDFLVIEPGQAIKSQSRLSRLASNICDRRSGVGADGILHITRSPRAYGKINVYNADGSWAEKSGNGLRIAGVYAFLKSGSGRRRAFDFETAGSTDTVTIDKKIGEGFMVSVDLEQPRFKTAVVPIRSRQRYMINSPLSIGGTKLPVTCLSVGNPHTVLFVNDFDFDWQALGGEIERHRAFPNRTNVEFVKIVTRKKVKLADWERGAGATGSSGTGAAAAVCAGVIMGILDRECEVVFDSGSLFIDWSEDSGVIRLTGPVVHVTSGKYEFK
ncbi:MAG: diaminopimelate epimerase [Candidatus Zixiibacteriota bacterium]|nr:MAG: diaminopimelate epimerase [candidate division Zixibacteria bacterium]